MDVANTTSVLSNGFWDISSDKGFHLALGTAIVAFVFLGLTANDR